MIVAVVLAMIMAPQVASGRCLSTTFCSLALLGSLRSHKLVDRHLTSGFVSVIEEGPKLPSSSRKKIEFRSVPGAPLRDRTERELPVVIQLKVLKGIVGQS